MPARAMDVLVVGAGAAGLRAAGVLSRAGARVLVVEARSRIGGRIWTLRPRGWPVAVELGAEFIHGRATETFRIAQEAGLLVERLPDSHWRATPRGLVPIPRLWDKVDRITRRMKARGPDRSVAEFLERRTLPRELAWLAAAIVEGYHAAPLDDVSEKSLSTAGEEPPEPGENAQFRLPGGYGEMVRHLRSRVDPARAKVRLGVAITEIRWTGRSVRARSADGEEFRARRALVTVPVGVLAAPLGSRGAIRFDPPLDGKRESIARLGASHVARLVLRFRESFWEEGSFLEARAAGNAKSRAREDLAFVHSRGANLPTWWSAAPAQVPTWVGWAGGPAAVSLLALPPAERDRVALSNLAALLRVPRSRLERLLVALHFHDWSADPFARGAYSYDRVGAGDARRRLGRALDDTLYFAGEATEPDHSGTVEGALVSGARAAKEILRRR